MHGAELMEPEELEEADRLYHLVQDEDLVMRIHEEELPPDEYYEALGVVKHNVRMVFCDIYTSSISPYYLGIEDEVCGRRDLLILFGVTLFGLHTIGGR